MIVFKLTSRSICGWNPIQLLLLTRQLSTRPISFTDLQVDGTLAKRLRTFDIRYPSPIQQQVNTLTVESFLGFQRVLIKFA